jgi:hypothetical protein
MTPSALLLFSSGPRGDTICWGLPFISAGVRDWLRCFLLGKRGGVSRLVLGGECTGLL